jgi:hypothetical protein
MPEDIFEQIKLFLPKYLTPSEQRELFQELKSFPDNRAFYLPPGALVEELLQGDGWKGFVAINFLTLEKKTVSGLILSNSCDIDARNERTLPTSVLFAPLIALARYRQRLIDAGKTDEQADATLRSIRVQHISNLFFLPPGPYGPEESIVLLDDIHAHPLTHFLASERTLLFRLNQYGFYILLIKLSIHFSRFQEGVKRMSA